MAYVPVPKDFSKIKTKLALNLTKRTNYMFFFWQEFVGFRVYLLTKDRTGNRCGSNAYDHSDAAIFSFLQCMKRMDFQQRKYCFTLSGRNF